MTDAFDALMADLDGPMVIVTTAAGDARSGCLVGFHAQCGMEPTRYAVWLSKANHTYRVGALADVFAVHFLSPENRPLAELFGRFTGDDMDKFELCSWTPGPDGVPLLDDSASRIVGRRDAWLDSGADHVCLMLEPIDTRHAKSAGWLTFGQVRDLDAGHPADERNSARTQTTDPPGAAIQPPPRTSGRARRGQIVLASSASEISGRAPRWLMTSAAASEPSRPEDSRS